MDFYEVLDQVIDLLRSRGRVTYRALKRQFGIDDDFLKDLQDEILYVHPVKQEIDARYETKISRSASTTNFSSRPPRISWTNFPRLPIEPTSMA